MAEADLAELEGLISECKRPRVKAQLEAYAGQLRELIGGATAPAKPAAASAASASAAAPPRPLVRCSNLAVALVVSPRFLGASMR